MRERSLLCIPLALLLFAPLALAGSGSEENPVLAKVGKVEIRASELQAKLDEIPSYARKNFLTREGKLKLLENLIKGEVLYQAALRVGLEGEAEVQEKIEDARRRILQSEYYRLKIKAGLEGTDEEALQQYYQEHQADYLLPAKVRSSHLMVKTEAEALLALEKIQGGAEFATLARERSLDPSTARSGGDLGWIETGGFIRGIGRDEAFEAALFDAEVDRIVGPVQTPKGWHLILVKEKVAPQPRPFDEVRTEIIQDLRVTDQAVAAEYETNRDDYMSRIRLKARHIVVPTKQKAEELRTSLLEGADFQELAREHSTDKLTSAKGGDLGYIYREGYIKGLGKQPEFEDAVFALAIGELSQPIKSKRGHHIVTVYEREDERYKTLDEVRSQIRNKLLRESKETDEEQQFQALKRRLKVKIFEDRITDSDPEE